ncbi:MAG TPA: glycosyl hydrolase, partial [Ignavibacteria bacterium]|nr:glycosyl hydrolase [Ignavibacteria bacterium]
STDGGRTFQNERISDSPFFPLQETFMGDYTNIAATNGIVRPIWTRLDSNKLSIWTAIIDK